MLVTSCDRDCNQVPEDSSTYPYLSSSKDVFTNIAETQLWILFDIEDMWSLPKVRWNTLFCALSRSYAVLSGLLQAHGGPSQCLAVIHGPLPPFRFPSRSFVAFLTFLGPWQSLKVICVPFTVLRGPSPPFHGNGRSMKGC